MRIPEILYEPTTKGFSGLAARRYSARGAALAAQVSVDVSHPVVGQLTMVDVGKEDVLHILGVCILATGGGGQTVREMILELFTGVGGPTTTGSGIQHRAGHQLNPIGLVAAVVSLHTLDILLLPGERLRARCEFSDSIANNNVEMSAWGFIYNRGNFQY